jgi:prepilin-type N-terminal cleavage/methylation domain-containing protein
MKRERILHSLRGRSGFTLVEVLATMMLIAIVLPAVMQGVSVATKAGADARRRTEAAGLASSKLAEIIATGQWQGGVMAGDFSPDWPDYRWQASVGNWPGDTSNVSLQEVDLSVFWTERGREDSVRVSTLTYVRPTSQ